MLTFNSNGLLPAGIHEMTFDQIRQSILVNGPQDKPIEGWDPDWRLRLINNAEFLVRQLMQVADNEVVRGKIGSVYLDGSFVTDKPRPGDIDGFFDVDLRTISIRDLERALNLISPDAIWTWSNLRRIPHPSGKPQLPMWIKYRVELFPHHPLILSGIPHEGRNLTFAEAFRLTREGQEKGIIKIVR